ncbi:hypothetical protein GWI33_020004 [Rhynchophorus ferrugineus]|uniref:Uncharacterized protein n=1 Tax=Rhynchophorus ferrugineus TaxID=354439 RepID=A0A834HQ94_RHYFE|nr:hypothetical protein GWI33_020004 [Rhynchophorus ferrugineus]
MAALKNGNHLQVDQSLTARKKMKPIKVPWCTSDWLISTIQNHARNLLPLMQIRRVRRLVKKKQKLIQKIHTQSLLDNVHYLPNLLQNRVSKPTPDDATLRTPNIVNVPLLKPFPEPSMLISGLL